jgi:anti-sigma factor RsiW
MNHDPVYRRLRELSWRRPLTESEQADLRAWLAAHPEAQAEWEVETNLSAMLQQLPDAPVPSNFTARVRQAVEREAMAAERRSGFPWTRRWRVFLPRTAAAVVFIGLGLFAYHRRTVLRQAELVRTVAAVREVPKPELLEDFEAIRRFGSTPSPDEELLALMK